MNPWLDYLQWASTPIAVIAIVVAIILYFRSKREEKPGYVSRTIELVGPHGALADEVRILYGSEEVPRVSSTRIIFWNRGRQTIDRQDIRKDYPLEIVFHRYDLQPSMTNDKSTGHEKRLFEIACLEDIRVLRSRVHKMSREHILFDVLDHTRDKSLPENKVRITFDFLDQNDGADIEVLHTGDRDVQFNVQGVIRGVAEIKNLGSFGREPSSERLTLSKRFLGYSAITVGIISILSNIYISLGNVVSNIGLIIGYFMGSYIAAYGALVIFSARRRYPEDLGVPGEID